MIFFIFISIATLSFTLSICPPVRSAMEEMLFIRLVFEIDILFFVVKLLCLSVSPSRNGGNMVYLAAI